MHKISLKDVKKIIGKKVDGKNYSERIYKNKNQVAKALKNEIIKLFNGETSVHEINKLISEKFDIDKSLTERLVRDQLSRVQNEINNKWFDDHDITKVMYMATLDKKACGDCKQYDGKVYDSNKKPVELPQHVNCRCTYTAIVDDFRPSRRLDNESKKEISFKNFEEWESKRKND